MGHESDFTAPCEFFLLVALIFPVLNFDTSQLDFRLYNGSFSSL